MDVLDKKKEAPTVIFGRRKERSGKGLRACALLDLGSLVRRALAVGKDAGTWWVRWVGSGVHGKRRKTMAKEISVFKFEKVKRRLKRWATQ